MNIAISNIAWENSEDDAIADILLKYSVRGIEVAPTKIWSDPINVSKTDVENYKQYWLKKGIAIVAMQSLVFGHPELTIFENFQKRKDLITYLSKIIQLASSLGVKAMVFGSPKNRIKGDLDDVKTNEIAYDFFNAVGKIAKQYDLNFCIEANPKSYGTDFLNTSGDVIQFVKTLNNSHIKVHLDTGAMELNNEDYKQTILNAQPFSHFHISEPNLAPVPSTVEHKKVADILRQIRYDKWVSIEMRPVASNNTEQIAKTLEFVSKIYR